MSTWGARHGLPGYDSLRTGLTFVAVQKMLWTDSNDSSTWKHKRRGSVLGLWHSIKMAIYDDACNRGYLDTLRSNHAT